MKTTPWINWFTHKGPVIRATFLFNLSRNIVALQIERVVARITTARSTCLATNFGGASWKKLLQKVELGSTLCNMFLQLATPKFVASWNLLLFNHLFTHEELVRGLRGTLEKTWGCLVYGLCIYTSRIRVAYRDPVIRVVINFCAT